MTDTVVVPLAPLTLVELRADFAKPLNRISMVASVLKHFGPDLTPEMTEVQLLLANDELMGDLLLLVNEARADGVTDFASFKAWGKAQVSALAAWLPKKAAT